VLKETVDLPEIFALESNYPNPFNPSTQIRYGLAETAVVTLVVYDLLGREVKRLLWNATQEAGRHEVTFDAADLSSGVYLYRLEARGSGESGSPAFIATKTMTLIK